jgi:hypothetical protein
MSEKMIKCKICDRVESEDECQLMTVIIDDEGEEVKVCCTHLIDQNK